MQLVSQRRHDVRIAGTDFHFEAQEPIVTELCHKYSIGDFAILAQSAGLRDAIVWQDAQHRFSMHLLVGEMSR